jgi:MFS family permease
MTLATPGCGDRRLLAVMCLTQVGNMLCLSTFSALLPVFLSEWQLSGSEAGWLNGISFAGYIATVPVLMALTDRVDARRIYLIGGSIMIAALVAFSLLAEGLWSASALRVLSGIGLAGTYMPGLKVLTDRLRTMEQSRAVAYYTASYGIGTALSFWASGLIGEWLGWRWAFGLIAIGPLFALALVVFAVPAKPPTAHEPTPLRQVFDFRAVFRNRRAVAYIISYTLHTGELMVCLSWTVAFLSFAAAASGAGIDGPTVTLIGALVALTGLPASILGNEGALRIGRRRFITMVTVLAAGISCFVGFAAGLPFYVAACLIVVYGVAIAGDSASLTAGTMAAAEPERQGATMAMHSFIGFVGGGAMPMLFGVVLDTAGGRDTVAAWGVAFACVGLLTLIGPIFLARWASEDTRPAAAHAGGS